MIFQVRKIILGLLFFKAGLDFGFVGGWLASHKIIQVPDEFSGTCLINIGTLLIVFLIFNIEVLKSTRLKGNITFIFIP